MICKMLPKIPEWSTLCFHNIKQAWKFNSKYIKYYRSIDHQLDNILKVNWKDIIIRAWIAYDKQWKLYREWIGVKNRIYWKDLSYDL